MRRTPVKIRTSPEVDVDGIVASFAALGGQERRDTRRRRWVRAGLAVTVVASSVWIALSGVPAAMLEWRATSAGGLRELREQMSAELEQLDVARAELAAERDHYRDSSASLERQLATFAERHRELQLQQAALAEQSTALQAAFTAVDTERAALLAAARTPSPAVERELAAIGEQRRDLEEQREAFSSQGQQLSDELARLEQRRDDLETERAVMEQQRRELEALIEDASRISERTSRIADPRLDPSLEPLFAAAVDAPALGEMRGGVQLGNGMNIAIGLTQSASINGVEQYSSSLQLDGLTAGMGSAALDAIGTTVIQNGAGNFVAPSVLDGLSGGFGTIIQNSLDGQEIRTSTTYDVAISDVASAIRDIAASQAISDSLGLHQ